ncbi:ribose transport system permease protein [Candidatus Hakubella thermalkaliphila]|uniref:Autoinducer 2 import system permease protein LsrD n=2 Tax=Candidatus Hakubella thermalkaliphila TaxID=2754717 RepID=A0A6V8NEL1_9ACTN|nr:ABC transporter permease [Candidatus Hakubella thermalkaliphila]MBT9170983.1 Autoinducer 2 import system permease protein LsrD [Actinomycetota bacterium]GFP18497.1 ribose transport system permease protein [Candidatus Hakubella thermalkaliphila]GFP22741.1 rhamnose transport system permease protein [Candidatus Hakubella thermalkaliphila]GFP36413.1 ribose transport system permease protein [Candidatus Hakubella thermalkaliphila]GFP42866.1 ribose transport system permease protein [Candidatus Hak
MTLEAGRLERGLQKRRLSPVAFLMRWELLLVLLIIVASTISTWLSPHFLVQRNLLDMTFHFVERSIIALPMMLITISGNMVDLSVASTLAMTAVLMGVSYQAGLNIWLAVLLALVVGALGGLLNGMVIVKARLSPIVVTLGTYSLYRGIAFVMLGNLYVTGYPPEFTYIGRGYVGNTPAPVPLVIFTILAVLFGLLLHRTTFGRFIYAMGGNEQACRYSGIAVDRIKIILFLLSGLMSALAGIMLSGRIGSTRPNIALGSELEVITAVVLGGVSISGGKGTVPGVILALFLIGIARWGMRLMGVPGEAVIVVIGLLLIVAILLPELLRRLAPGARE